MDKIFWFEWQKAVKGYAIEQAADGRDVITDGTPTDQTLRVEAYEAPQDLYVKFADIPNSNEAVLSFANKWGLLADHSAADETLWVQSTLLMNGRKVQAEAIEDWFWQIEKLREAVGLWKESQDENFSKLSRVIKIDATSVEMNRRNATTPTGMITLDRFRFTEEDEPSLFRRAKAKDLAPVAKYFVHKLINARLRDQEGITLRMIWDEQNNRPRLQIIPRNLISAMWLQFSRAVDGNMDHRQCLICGKFMLVSRDPQLGSRRDRVTDSDACRNKLSRLRRAVKIDSAKGMSTLAIAKKHRYPTQTIQHVLKPGRKSPQRRKQI